MNALASILEWPSEPTDLFGLALWDAAEIARATGGIASCDFQVSGVEIDSRDVVPGDLFFALKGETMEGHRFVDMAFARGASATATASSRATPTAGSAHTTRPRWRSTKN